MANEFVAKNGLISQNNSVVSGSLTLVSSGQLLVKTGTATGVSQQTTDFGSGAGSNIGFGLAAATGNTYGTLTVRNTGGSSSGNLAILSSGGNLAIGKSTFNAVLDVNGNTLITGSLNVTAGISASLQGTASFATSASFATTASYAMNGGGGGGISQGQVVAIATGYSNLF